MALDINHAKQLNYNREFCELEVNQNSQLTLKVKSLNIFQRILRVLFGAYHTTIWTQKKIDHLADAYPKDTQKIIDLVETLNLYRKSPLSAPRDPKEIQRTIMIVGPSQIGKTTAITGLDDYSKVVDTKISFFAKTEAAHAISIPIGEQTINIIDTPGLSEDRGISEQHKKRDNATLIQQTKEVVEKQFKGKGFQHVGKVIFAVTLTVCMQDKFIETIDAYTAELKHQQEVFLLFTHAEGSTEKERWGWVEQLYDHEKHGPKIRQLFKPENILFMGALTQDRVMRTTDETIIWKLLTKVAKFKKTLFRRIFEGTIELETLKAYCVARANAFRANKQSILENLEAYRKLIKQQELEDSQK